MERFAPFSDEVDSLTETYTATYKDEYAIPVVDRTGPTEAQALEDLYKKLEQLGHTRSGLPHLPTSTKQTTIKAVLSL